MDELRIRAAGTGDVAALANLMTELGHPTSVEDMKRRFEEISAPAQQLDSAQSSNSGFRRHTYRSPTWPFWNHNHCRRLGGWRVTSVRQLTAPATPEARESPETAPEGAEPRSAAGGQREAVHGGGTPVEGAEVA